MDWGLKNASPRGNGVEDASGGGGELILKFYT